MRLLFGCERLLLVEPEPFPEAGVPPAREFPALPLPPAGRPLPPDVVGLADPLAEAAAPAAPAALAVPRAFCSCSALSSRPRNQARPPVLSAGFDVLASLAPLAWLAAAAGGGVPLLLPELRGVGFDR